MQSRAVVVRLVVVALGCLGATGCLPRERLNDECRWTERTPAGAGRGDGVSRAHLGEDVRVAHWLAIRHSDATLPRLFTPEVRRARARCVGASFARIARLHGVAIARLFPLERVRDPWIDVLAVYLPMAALFLLACRRMISRTLDGADADGRWLAALLLVIWMPIAAGFGVGATQMWAWVVETMRVRDGHISYRLMWVPAFQPRYGWMTWQGGVALYLVALASVALGRPRSAERRARAERPPLRRIA